MGKKQAAHVVQQAAALLQSGRLLEAHQMLSQAAQRAKRDPDIWFLLGSVNGQLGRMEDVTACCQRVLSLVPNHPGALSNLGNAQSALGNHEQALVHYRKALRITPNDPAIHNNLGKTLFSLERKTEAEEHLRRALAANPTNVEARHNLADALQEKGALEEAIENYREALRLNPELQQAHRQMANALRQTGRLEESRKSYLRALELKPDDPDALFGLGFLYNELGALEFAVDCLEGSLQISPDSVPALCALGRVRIDQGRYQPAIDTYRRALALEPDNLEALGGIADALEHQGDLDGAYALAKAAPDAGESGMLLTLVLARLCRHFQCCDQAVDALDRILARTDLADGPRRTIHFAAGKLHDSLKHYERAFDHFAKANALSRYRFDRQAHSARVDGLMATFSAGKLGRLPCSDQDSELPVFIVGMPRSGTSLVEQILASHPQAYGAGERNDINRLALELPTRLGSAAPYPQCLEEANQAQMSALARTFLEQLQALAPEAARITDKMPANFLHLGFIARLFPRCRIIHCTRDPVDTCLSVYFQHFSGSHPYATELGDVGHYYREYRRLMAHWEQTLEVPIMTVNYEELVADQERISRALVDFCGLPWDASCLQFHKTARRVATASYDQVRAPIYSRSVQRWRHYEGHLEPLLRELGDLIESG